MFWTIVAIILFKLLPYFLSVFLQSYCLLLIVFSQWLYNQSGELFLTLQKHKYRQLLFIGVVTCLFVLGANICSLDNIWFAEVADSLISIGFFLWLRAYYPIEFREKGVVIFGYLIRWSKICRYQWQNNLLLLEHKTWFGDRKAKIRVNRQQQSQIEFILRKKIIIV